MSECGLGGIPWEAIATALGAAAASWGVVYAARQIKVAASDQRAKEEWRKTNLGLELIRRLEIDDELAFCCRALDWGVGPLIVPQKYQVLFTDGRRTFEHEPKQMMEALGVGLSADDNNEERWRAPEALTYRYSFDSFFNHLDTIRLYLQNAKIQPSEMEPLEYYWELVRKPKYVPATLSFRPFVHNYYSEARRLYLDHSALVDFKLSA
jgi:hypothetical protein